MKNIKKILIIIQRSNGDVFLSLSLINALYKYYKAPQIDLLVNEDTIAVAKQMPYIQNIHIFSYQKKQNSRLKQEKNIVQKIFKKYDLSISLTASDRSVIYALLAGKKSISAIEKDKNKSWWKKKFLSDHYYFDYSKHILLNNLQTLNLLKIEHNLVQSEVKLTDSIISKVKLKLRKRGIEKFIIYHPSAQYNYKIYPQKLRHELLSYLSNLGVNILVTGGNNKIDLEIKKQLITLPNIIDFIGETTLEEYFALSELSLAYIGMDTLNMHIAASQNKRIFAIFGPTNLSMWSPWSNDYNISATFDRPIQTYGKVTIFQANMPCVACGMAGCDDKHGNSDCLDNIDPKNIFSSVESWFYKKDMRPEFPVIVENINSKRKILLYIVYGDDQTYYDGAIFSFLTFKNWMKDDDPIEVVVLTEKPEKFASYPIRVVPMTRHQKKEWSLNDAYHFRIKNRGMAYVMDYLNLQDFDKILFFDTDTYFNKSPMKLFDLILTKQALFYLNEGLIYDRKRFFVYVKHLEGKKIEIDGEIYELSKESALWGSLMIGINATMRPSLDWADKLMIKFFELVPSHTIEPFALSESLLRKYTMVEGKSFVSLYSTSRKKEHAMKVLSKFFEKNKLLEVDEQVRLAQKVKIKRPLFVILRQRFLRIIRS